MSKKRITYSIKLKTRLVLEVLKGEKTVNAENFGKLS